MWFYVICRLKLYEILMMTIEQGKTNYKHHQAKIHKKNKVD